MHFQKFSPLLGLLFHDTGLGRYRNSTLLSNNTDRFRKGYSFCEHHKLKNVTANLATEAVEKLLIPTDCKEGVFSVWKGQRPLRAFPVPLSAT